MAYDWVLALGKSLGHLWDRVVAYLPSVLGAAALLVLGWLVARLLRGVTVRLLDRLGWLARSRVLAGALRRIGVERSVVELAGRIVFWLVLLLFVVAATEALGLPVLAAWLGAVSRYLPRVLIGVLIILAGLLGGSLAREAVTTAAAGARIAYGPILGRVAQGAIVLIAVVTGVDQFGIDSRFLTATVTIVLAAAIGGLALAFGIGARTTVSNVLAAHYLRRTYRVGHTVRVGGVEGMIIEITPTAVILQAREGQVSVPAKEFSETVSVLVTTGGS